MILPEVAAHRCQNQSETLPSPRPMVIPALASVKGNAATDTASTACRNETLSECEIDNSQCYSVTQGCIDRAVGERPRAKAQTSLSIYRPLGRCRSLATDAASAFKVEPVIGPPTTLTVSTAGQMGLSWIAFSAGRRCSGYQGIDRPAVD